jgi:hypothetical protein
MNWRRDFFVGWSGSLPADQAGWVRAVVAALVGGCLLAGLALARAQDDPGGATGTGEQVLEGVLTARPYPTLTPLPPRPDGSQARTLLPSGGGKDGAPLDTALDGRAVRATGFGLRRGDLAMLQVSEPMAALQAALPSPEIENLGTWRITGEICDGKCLAGAMRPGSGIAHRACANLCVTGGVPPVLVATGPVRGQRYLLLGDPDGGPVNGQFRDLTALLVTLEGQVERRGDLLIFRPDLSRAVVR